MLKIGREKTRPNTLVSAASVRGRTLADKVYCRGAGFQHVDYLPALSARRTRAQAAQHTQVLDTVTCRRVIIENFSSGKYGGRIM